MRGKNPEEIIEVNRSICKRISEWMFKENIFDSLKEKIKVIRDFYKNITSNQ